jgi:hypothetical protein
MLQEGKWNETNARSLSEWIPKDRTEMLVFSKIYTPTCNDFQFRSVKQSKRGNEHTTGQVIMKVWLLRLLERPALRDLR